MDNQIFTTILTGTVTIVSVLVSQYLIKKKDDRNKRLQIRTEYISKQIEELYGPLYSLIQQKKNYWAVRKVITSVKGIEEHTLNRIILFFREEYHLPLDNEIRELIKTKFHLIEGKELPDSFWDCLRHSTQQSSQIQLWKELKIDTQYAVGTPWPEQFEIDIKNTLDELMRKYDDLIKELE